MAEKFHLNITTPDKVIYDGTITSLIAPGATGYLGILAHHRPIATLLSAGDITIKDGEGKESIFHSSGSGFLEVSNNSATMLLDSV